MSEEILAKLDAVKLGQDQLGQDVAGLRQDVEEDFGGLRQDFKGLRLGQGHLLEKVEALATRLENIDKNLLDLRRTTTDSHEVLLALIQQRAS